MEMKFERVVYSNEKFKKNLDYLVKKTNVTKKQIEKELITGEGALSRYCKTDDKPTIPSIEIINSLAKGFGVTIDELINKDLEEKEKLLVENRTRKDILFCKKLIEETNNNMCNWRYCNFDELVSGNYYNSIVKYDPYDDSVKEFKSIFSDKTYRWREADVAIASIKDYIRVLIVRLPIANVINDSRYELYLINDNDKILPAGSSHGYLDELTMDINENPSFDEYLYSNLKMLYETVSNYILFGKEMFEIEKVYDEYLYPDEEPF